MQADMRVLRPGEGPELLARHSSRRGWRRRAGTCRCTRSAARWRWPTSSEERAILSLIGPRGVEIAGAAALPENACEALAVAGIECLAVGTATAST